MSLGTLSLACLFWVPCFLFGRPSRMGLRLSSTMDVSLLNGTRVGPRGKEATLTYLLKLKGLLSNPCGLA